MSFSIGSRFNSLLQDFGQMLEGTGSNLSTNSNLLGSTNQAGTAGSAVGTSAPHEATGAFRALRGSNSDGIESGGENSNFQKLEAEIRQLMQMLQSLLAAQQGGGSTASQGGGNGSTQGAGDGSTQGGDDGSGQGSGASRAGGHEHHRHEHRGHDHHGPPVRAHPSTPAAGSAGGSEAAALSAMQKLVARHPPYVWGGTGKTGYDCSGLCGAAYHAAGFDMPRTAKLQYLTGPHISRADLKPGDLVFWGGNASTIHHVAMYAGHGQIYSADQTGDVARLQPMWIGDYYGATRPTKAMAAAEVARSGSQWEPGH